MDFICKNTFICGDANLKDEKIIILFLDHFLWDLPNSHEILIMLEVDTFLEPCWKKIWFLTESIKITS